MKFISLFTGIGGLDLGLERAGMECVAQVEIDDFCQKVLTKHWVNVPKYKDVCDVRKHNLPTAELICGGFPCQDVSIAGKRAGLEGKRSTLWSEFHRIVCEIRPRWVVIENVTGLLNSDGGRFFKRILNDLFQSGYDAEWRTFFASDFGAPHERERVFVVAYTDRSGWIRDEVFSICNNELNDKREKEKSASAYPLSFNFFGRKYPGIPEDLLVDDGLPVELDEIKKTIKAFGNSIVPQVAQYVGECILSATNEVKK